MIAAEFIKLFEESQKRYHLVGNSDCGVLIGLDLEGRLFTILNGEVVNKINPDAVTGITDRKEYLNPGGDGLWPAPEGTKFGYEYTTGDWRVPPALTGANYTVTEQGATFAKIEAEVDLINNIGVGIPTIFKRHVSLEPVTGGLAVNVTEAIQYIGKTPLSRDKCLLAPWTLCQFDSGDGCEVRFPVTSDDAVWDLYGSSAEKRYQKNGLWHTKTDGGIRYQIAMDESIDWIEYHNPAKNLTVKRTASTLPQGQCYIDIVDAPPNELPSEKGIRFSVYSDPSLFMEIEACGGCPDVITPGDELSVDVQTVYLMD